MDINKALADCRAAMRVVLEADTVEAELVAAQELADAFEAVDEWLSIGGFLPDAWIDGAWRRLP